MATIKFKTFYEANFFAKKMASEQRVSLSVKRVNEEFLVEGNFRISQNDVFIPPKPVAVKSVVKNNTISSKKTNNSPSKNTYEPSQHSHLTEEQKAAILDARKNKERDRNPNLIKKPHYSNQEESKRGINSDDLRLCIDCGKYIPIGRNDPRCVPCKTLYEKSHDTRPKIDEGIAGTREANKKMNARQWGEMVNRGKGK